MNTTVPNEPQHNPPRDWAAQGQPRQGQYGTRPRAAHSLLQDGHVTARNGERQRKRSNEMQQRLNLLKCPIVAACNDRAACAASRPGWLAQTATHTGVGCVVIAYRPSRYSSGEIIQMSHPTATGGRHKVSPHGSRSWENNLGMRTAKAVALRCDRR